MLSPLAYTVLANRKLVGNDSLRIFMAIMSDYDLTKFRVLSRKQMQKDYEIAPNALDLAMRTLLGVGLLERGPIAKIQNSDKRFATYRVRQAYLMTPKLLKDHFEEMRKQEERESIAPMA